MKIPRLDLLVEDDDEKLYVPLWVFGAVVTIIMMALAFVAAGLLTVLSQH